MGESKWREGKVRRARSPVPVRHLPARAPGRLALLGWRASLKWQAGIRILDFLLCWSRLFGFLVFSAGNGLDKVR